MTAPVERFPPTNGQVTGWLGVSMAAVVGAVSIVTSPGLVGMRILLGAALLGLLIWMVVLRPRAAVNDAVLLLRQEATDTRVPLTLIDTVHVGRALTVTVGERRYLCTGISRTRPPVGRRAGASASMVRGSGAPDPAVGSPATYVENRIRDVVADAHRRGHDSGGHAVRRTWAVPELVALGVLVAGFLVALLL